MERSTLHAQDSGAATKAFERTCTMRATQTRDGRHHRGNKQEIDSGKRFCWWGTADRYKQTDVQSRERARE